MMARPGRATEALAALQRALELLEADRPEEAERSAETAKALVPRSAGVREVLAIARYRAGRYREALRELQAYRRISGRNDQNHLIADCHRALGSPERAVDEARRALRSRIPDEARAEAAVVGAAALADLGRHDEALAFLRSFPTPREDVARPYDLRVWYVAGDILERAGRTRDAAREFARIVRYDPSAFDAAQRLARLTEPSG